MKRPTARPPDKALKFRADTPCLPDTGRKAPPPPWADRDGTAASSSLRPFHTDATAHLLPGLSAQQRGCSSSSLSNRAREFRGRDGLNDMPGSTSSLTLAACAATPPPP